MIKYHPNFRLYLFVSDIEAIDDELLSKACLINFSSTEKAQWQVFLKAAFEKEAPEFADDLQRVQVRDLEISGQIQNKETEMLELLDQSESNILDSKSLTDQILAAKAELIELEKIAAELKVSLIHLSKFKITQIFNLFP